MKLTMEAGSAVAEVPCRVCLGTLAAGQGVLAAQTRFLELIAHELRAPLAAVGNAAVALRTLTLDDAQRTRIHGLVERQVQHASRLVDDLLDLSRASAGKLRLTVGRVDMGEIVDAAVDVCKPLLERRGQTLTIMVPPSGSHVLGDPVRLAQILNNLLENASKYTPERGDIGLSACVDEDFFVLTVADSGIGMTADASLSIFDPLFQESHAVAFNGTGLGIGLAVVRELVEAHGGTVAGRSDGLRRGSQFVVRLPLAQGLAFNMVQAPENGHGARAG
jgi:signal transduction histidine kinase